MDRIQIWNKVKNRCEGVKLPCYRYQYEEQNIPRKYDKTEVICIQSDTLEAARMYPLHQTIILIFGDSIHPGGCVEAGAGMQEESLFRRTALFSALPKEEYPIRDLEALYTPNIPIWYDTEQNGFKPLKLALHANFVNIPAVKMPRIENNRMGPEDTALFKNKIRLLFQVSMKTELGTIIAGAWGCGVFGCPAVQVAELFKEVIDEYNGSVKTVVFAILGKSYHIFNDVFH